MRAGTRSATARTTGAVADHNHHESARARPARVPPRSGRSPQSERKRSLRSLVAEQGADSLDRGEIVVVPDRPYRAPVRQRLVDGEIEARVDRLELRAVERAASGRHRGAAARGPPPCG